MSDDDSFVATDREAGVWILSPDAVCSFVSWSFRGSYTGLVSSISTIKTRHVLHIQRCRQPIVFVL